MYAQRHPDLFSACYAMSAWLSFDGNNDYPKDSRPYRHLREDGAVTSPKRGYWMPIEL